MKVVGLTGGIATGKSTVARIFRALGAHVVDADELARAVVEPDRPAWKEIVEAFGPEVLQADRTLDRARLGDLIFKDPTRRKQLESITHPRIAEEMQRRIQEGGGLGASVVILDVPLLYESKMDAWLRPVIVVYAPPEVQIERLTKRDGLNREQARQRIGAQMPIEEKRRRADHLIDNTGTLDDLNRRIEALWKLLTDAA